MKFPEIQAVENLAKKKFEVLFYFFYDNNDRIPVREYRSVEKRMPQRSEFR